MSAYATCITAYQPNRLMSTGFVPSSVFHGVRHPATLGSSEVEAFLSWLANERKVSVSTHRQALAALLFFYGKVLCLDLPWLQEIGRPRPSRRLPVVLTPDEVVRILGFLEGEHRSPSFCMERACGSSEGLQLRVKDLDFDHGTIIVREGQGLKDRALMLQELGTQPARATVACTGMVAEGPGRGPQRLRFPTPGRYPPGIPGRGSGFCAAHAFDRSTERCRASPSHV